MHALSAAAGVRTAAVGVGLLFLADGFLPGRASKAVAAAGAACAAYAAVPASSADTASNDVPSVFRVRFFMVVASPQAVFSWSPTGSLRSRLPVAAKIALATAAPTPVMPISPMPRAPIGA